MGLKLRKGHSKMSLKSDIRTASFALSCSSGETFFQTLNRLFVDFLLSHKNCK